jgi:dTDP-glucose pyrophosphorylase
MYEAFPHDLAALSSYEVQDPRQYGVAIVEELAH